MQNLQWIFSGIGVLALSLTIGFIAKRRAAHRSTKPELPALTYPRNAKTFRSVARVELGSFVDFEFPSYELGVDLVEIRTGKKKYSNVDEPFALVRIRHHEMYAGRNVEVVEHGFQFLMPKSILEQHDSVFAFHLASDYSWRFARIVITHINHHSGWADFEFSGFSAQR